MVTANTLFAYVVGLVVGFLWARHRAERKLKLHTRSLYEAAYHELCRGMVQSSKLSIVVRTFDARPFVRASNHTTITPGCEFPYGGQIESVTLEIPRYVNAPELTKGQEVMGGTILTWPWGTAK